MPGTGYIVFFCPFILILLSGNVVMPAFIVTQLRTRFLLVRLVFIAIQTGIWCRLSYNFDLSYNSHLILINVEG